MLHVGVSMGVSTNSVASLDLVHTVCFSLEIGVVGSALPLSVYMCVCAIKLLMHTLSSWVEKAR